LLEGVYRHYGLDFRGYALGSLKRRLARRMREEGTPTLSALQEKVLHDPAAMERLLKARPDIDAVFAASDLMAAGAMSVLEAAGRRIPQDVAVVGYDDSPVASTLRPRLTSVRQPIEEMGHEMTRLLVDAVEGTDSVQRRVILATELIRRASSAGRRVP